MNLILKFRWSIKLLNNVFNPKSIELGTHYGIEQVELELAMALVWRPHFPLRRTRGVSGPPAQLSFGLTNISGQEVQVEHSMTPINTNYYKPKRSSPKCLNT